MFDDWIEKGCVRCAKDGGGDSGKSNATDEDSQEAELPSTSLKVTPTLDAADVPNSGLSKKSSSKRKAKAVES